ncbi:hypothetical protein GCM10023094_35470 [Rhodococcus olei]|uniref:Uncharacterized protein n=1 Tax=Rhodococcus olei TaxID=2161675 RepID=A0ABP8P8K5_9NOCA
MVRDDAGGLPDDRDAAGAVPCGAGVRERQLRIVVEQFGRHHQVPGDGVRVRLVEAEQIPADRRIQLAGLDLLGQIRLVGTRGTAFGTGAAVAGTRRESALAATTLRSPIAPVRAAALATGTVIVAPSLLAAVLAAALAALTATVTPVLTATGTTVVAPVSAAMLASGSPIVSPVAAALATIATPAVTTTTFAAAGTTVVAAVSAARFTVTFASGSPILAAMVARTPVATATVATITTTTFGATPIVSVSAVVTTTAVAGPAARTIAALPLVVLAVSPMPVLPVAAASVAALRGATTTPIRIVASERAAICVVVRHNISFEDNTGMIMKTRKGTQFDGSPFGCYVRRCPTLPHPVECSTIGAGGLSFRVRNGTGRFPSAMAAVTL